MMQNIIFPIKVFTDNQYQMIENVQAWDNLLQKFTFKNKY